MLRRYIDEITQIDNVKARVLIDTNSNFECILVNRNKIASESELKASTTKEQPGFSFRPNEKGIFYSIKNKENSTQKNYQLSFDQYRLFWIEENMYYSGNSNKELGPQDIAETIWNEWLESVGIL